MGGGSSPQVQPAVAAPKDNSAEVSAAIEKEKLLARKRKGRSSTILTSLTNDNSGETTTKKTLLGS